MNALTIFIRRPVLATMLTTLLLVLGLFSYRGLGVDTLPKIDIPVVTVVTLMTGASPEEVESQISKPLEEAVNTVAGIEELTSYSYEGKSVIVIRFVLERAIAEAVQDVRDKVSAAIYKLPDGIEQPVVTRIDFDAMPVLTLAVRGPRELKEVSEITRLKVKEAIENTPGVGEVTVIGGRTRAINVELDLDKLQAAGVSIAQVKAALAAQNVEIPAGRIDRGDSEQVLRTLGRIETIEDFNRLIVATKNGRQITVGDLGTTKDSVEEPRGLARVWKKGDAGLGQNAVTLNIVKQSGTNTVEVVDNVKKRLEQITPTLPKGLAIDTISDQSTFIRRSIDELKLHLVLGGFLAAIAVMLFMRDIRSTLIAAIAIPTSLIATFTLMKALNFTLNNMSLLGLTLAVGIVIDDAIVVLENIFRHMEELGKKPFDAAIDGLKEIGMAVMATTTSLCVIFLPVAFMQGMVGRFFYEFGLTVAFAIAISLVISFTLTPMLSSRFLRPKKHARSEEEIQSGLMHRAYGAMLRWSLSHRLWVVLIAILTVFMTVPIVGRLGKDFMPNDDRNEFQLGVIVPVGSSLETANQTFTKLEKELHEIPGVIMTGTQIGNGDDVTQGSIYVALEDISKRDYSQFDVMREARKRFKKYPEIRVGVNNLGGFSGQSSKPQFQFNIIGPDLDRLKEYADKVATKLKAVPGMVDVDNSLASRKPEVRVHLNRQKAADVGISAAEVASTLRTMVAGEKVTKFREGVEQYDVWVRLNAKDRDRAEVIHRLPLQSNKGGLVTLNQVADLDDGQGPAEIDRYNRTRLVTLYANLDGIDMGTASKLSKQYLDELKLPPGYGSALTGQASRMGETMTNMILAFVMAFIFMYIVLAAQFESFLHPVTILLSLPLTLPFAMLSLLILRENLNMYSLLGVFMLFGIVKKNGILQIDYTNTLRAQGVPLKEAILRANHARVRPILMTTITLIAGMIPIALGAGPGAAARAALAKVIIGGQAMSLLITLMIVPVAYSLFEGLKGRIWKTKSEPETSLPAAPDGDAAT